MKISLLLLCIVNVICAYSQPIDKSDLYFESIEMVGKEKAKKASAKFQTKEYSLIKVYVTDSVYAMIVKASNEELEGYYLFYRNLSSKKYNVYPLKFQDWTPTILKTGEKHYIKGRVTFWADLSLSFRIVDEFGSGTASRQSMSIWFVKDNVLQQCAVTLFHESRGTSTCDGPYYSRTPSNYIYATSDGIEITTRFSGRGEEIVRNDFTRVYTLEGNTFKYSEVKNAPKPSLNSLQ